MFNLTSFATPKSSKNGSKIQELSVSFGMGTLYKKTNSNNYVFSYRRDGKNIRIMGEEHGLNNLVFNNKHEKNKLKQRLEEKFEYGKYRRYGSKTPKLRVVIDDLKIDREKKVKMNTLSINTYDGEVQRLELFWEYVKDKFGYIIISRLDDKILNQYTDYCRNSRVIHLRPFTTTIR